jgi:hypothetical protein
VPKREFQLQRLPCNECSMQSIENMSIDVPRFS